MILKSGFKSTIKKKTSLTQLGETNGLPQTIAHRGYRARFPENTLSAFKGAIAAGCHALEMDLQVSRDGVVVISHV